MNLLTHSKVLGHIFDPDLCAGNVLLQIGEKTINNYSLTLPPSISFPFTHFLSLTHTMPCAIYALPTTITTKQLLLWTSIIYYNLP